MFHYQRNILFKLQSVSFLKIPVEEVGRLLFWSFENSLRRNSTKKWNLVYQLVFGRNEPDRNNSAVRQREMAILPLNLFCSLSAALAAPAVTQLKQHWTPLLVVWPGIRGASAGGQHGHCSSARIQRDPDLTLVTMLYCQSKQRCNARNQLAVSCQFSLVGEGLSKMV